MHRRTGPVRLHVALLAVGLLLTFLPRGRVELRAQTTAIPVLTAERTEALVQAFERRLHYVPGEVLVKFKPGQSPARQQRALMALRSRPSIDQLQWRGDVALLVDESQPDSRILAAQLMEQPEVEYAEPNPLARLPVKRFGAFAIPRSTRRPFVTPNDADFFSFQWNLTLLEMPKVWDINPGADNSIIVAVVDTGVTTGRQTLTFPLWTGSSIENTAMTVDISPELETSRFVGARDFVPLSGAGGAVFDMDGHGTHVSSTIAETTNNSLGLAGIAYKVRIMPVKVCTTYWELMIANAQRGVTGYLPLDAGGCPGDAVVTGIRYAADNGAKVINLSLGGDEPSTSEQEAIRYAVSKGAFVAIAMGNDYEDGNPVNYPAAYAQSITGAMSVGAIGKTQTRAYYSSTGGYCEIVAPGGDDTVGGGSDRGYIWQETLHPNFVDRMRGVVIPRFDVYAEVGYVGTSMATPHVAGVAALLMSQTKGTVTPAVVETQIRNTARDLGRPGKDDEYGWGLIQPLKVLFGSGIRK